jgi:iron complex transport system substrate-binding protein
MIKQLSALFLLLLSVSAVGKPMRIVSLNPCIDAILLEVAEPSQIAALSFYSSDPAATSISITRAAAFKIARGTAEDTILLKPDLVFGSIYETPQLRSVLLKYHIPITLYDITNTLSSSFEQIRDIAAKVGRPQKGAELIQKIEASLRATKAPASRPKIASLIYRSEGLVLGSGTLTEALLTHTGFQNTSKTYGIAAYGTLPLEKLVRSPPALLLRATDATANSRILSHPILAKMKIAMRDIPARQLNCAGPSIIEATQTLARVRKSL